MKTELPVKKQSKGTTISQEILKLKKGDGIVTAEDVVRAATPKNSPLHGYFTWDDSVAGHQFRLEQARGLIALVVITPMPDRRPIRAMVSLHSDRKRRNGGYRLVVEVLNHSQKRKELLAQALSELESHQRRYGHLSELARVYQEVRRVRKESR